MKYYVVIWISSLLLCPIVWTNLTNIMVDEKEYVCLYRSSVPGILVCEGCMSTVAVTVEENCHLEGDVRGFQRVKGCPLIWMPAVQVCSMCDMYWWFTHFCVLHFSYPSPHVLVQVAITKCYRQGSLQAEEVSDTSLSKSKIRLLARSSSDEAGSGSRETPFPCFFIIWKAGEEALWSPFNKVIYEGSTLMSQSFHFPIWSSWVYDFNIWIRAGGGDTIICYTAWQIIPKPKT